MNPYLRAAQQRPELKAIAAEALEIRRQEQSNLVRARDDRGRFIADDPTTPENEAWKLEGT